LRVVDSIPALCGPNACSQKLRSGEIAYRDNIHLNVTGGRRFARASGLSEAIVQAMHPSAARETSTPYRRVRPRSWQ
ncbi:MAG TPA: hypothetical protein VLX90_11695, partial [Steroidobacteraceae bacterium]|nr:hypothetical protein [Steroidobacteraceae bacterium]